MALSLTDAPTLPALSDPATFNDRALALFGWLANTHIPELEAISADDFLPFSVGSAAAPSISFTGDPDSGFFEAGANAVGVAIGGNELARFASGTFLVGSNTQVGFGGGQGAMLTESGGLGLGIGSGITGAALQRADTGTPYVSFWYGPLNSAPTSVGGITTNGAGVSYNTASDYRLKTDVQIVTGALDRLADLRPVNFEWLATGTRVDGFLAHEAAEVVPEAITGAKDATDANGNPIHQGIDQSKLVPLLTAALQEAVAKIDALETRVAALEGA